MLNSFKTLSTILKAIAAFAGVSMIAGAFIGLPFMQKEFSYLNKIAVTIICLIAGTLYLLPNSYLLKNRVIFFSFIVSASSFFSLGVFEAYAAFINNKELIVEVITGIIVCISAPASLYFYWLGRGRS